MPRVVKKDARIPDKLDLALNALITSPETCMVGEGCGCSALGGDQALVESLAAFIAHGDGSRRLFVERGGLHVISSLLSKAFSIEVKVKDELDEAYEDPVFLDEEGDGEQQALGSQALGGLVLLQALTNSSLGQESIVSQSSLGLISKVLQLAASEDETLRSAALQVVGGWLDGKGAIARAVKSNDILSLCLDTSIHHASMAVRRNAAQVLSVVEPNEEAEARIMELAETVRRSLAEASEAAPPYHPTMYFTLPSHSSETSSKRRLVLGFIELGRALALSDPPALHPLLKPICINTLVDVFTCAWSVPLGLSSQQTCCYWLQDHQIKESALDALMDLSRSCAWVQSTGDQCLASLSALVMALLGKTGSAGHIRASLALLGAINLPPGPLPSSLLSQLSMLLDLLADIFDAAWRSELHEQGKEEPTAGASDHPPSPGTKEGKIFTAVEQVSLLSLPHQAGSHFEFSSKKSVVEVEAGLGYRILLQALQAWRQIFARCSASPLLLVQLEKTKWRECIKLATKHSRHQVSTAALDLLTVIDHQLAKKCDEIIDPDLKAAFSDAEEGPEIKPLISDEELKEVLNSSQEEPPDLEMVEFLRSFLDASLSINEEEESEEENPDGMFGLWKDGRAEEDELKQVKEAMGLLPDPRNKGRSCIKYDILFD